MYILFFLVFGLVVGLIARALMPGNQSMGVLSTMLLGVGGSLVGGVVGTLLSHGSWNHLHAAGWIGSIVGALLLLAIGIGTGRARSRHI